MTLAEELDDHSVFIDANIFIYHFGGHSSQCKAFLERCAQRELLGYTSTPVLAEVLHHLMVVEAIVKGLITAETVVRKLWETPDLVKQRPRSPRAAQRADSIYSKLLLGSDAVQREVRSSQFGQVNSSSSSTSFFTN
jgi:predicted nucleic acid-binding protein